MKKLIAFFVTGVLLLAGCGGGGATDGTTGDLPDTRPSAVVSGTAFDGLIINGTVNIYDWSTGKKGALLASGQTDGQGLYSISISTPDKPILVEVTNGYYIEEASGVQIQLKPDQGQKLLAVTNYRSGVPVTISATFFTTVAAGYAEYLVDQGTSPINAVINANAEVSQWAGFDIETTTPLDAANVANASPVLTDGHRYGLVAAGISELTKQLHIDAGQPPHFTWPSVHVIGLAYDDIRADGVLDGKGSGGQPLAVGNLALNMDTFRATLADYVLRFVARNSRNATGLTFDDVRDFALALNSYASALFGNTSPGTDISRRMPVVQQFTPAEGTIVSGTYPVNALVSDPYGIALVEYYVDGQFVAGAGNPENPAQSIVTTNFSNGSHQFEIRVTNLWGNTTTVSHNVTVANGTVSLSLPIGTKKRTNSNNRYACTFTVTVNDGAGLGIKILTRGGLYVASNFPGGSKFNFSKTMYNGECVTETFRAEDNLGNITTGRFSIKMYGPNGALPMCWFNRAGDCSQW